MKRSLRLFVLLPAALLAACEPPAPAMTQMQMREFQTRAYDVQDIKMAMKAVLNVLQDDGFVVKQADLELGFLNAVKETPVAGAGFARVWFGNNATFSTNDVVECTANVSIFNQQTRVRMNFIRKKMNNKGGVDEISQLLDQRFYQEFFAKVDKGMFIEKERL